MRWTLLVVAAVAFQVAIMFAMLHVVVATVGECDVRSDRDVEIRVRQP